MENVVFQSYGIGDFNAWKTLFSEGDCLKDLGEVIFFKGKGVDCNSYLLKGDKNVLVDPGLPSKVTELKQKIDEVDLIVNTHCHFDHSGADHLFDGPVLIHELEVSVLQRGNDEVSCASFFNGSLEPVEAKPLGKEIEGWKVIHTPGHSAGSICLKKGRYLISGDTKFAIGHGRADLLTSSPKDLEKSLKRIESLDYEVLLPGHGKIVR